MKKNYPVTGKELDYDHNIRIISLTDAKGSITHINRDFISVSGYSEDELLHKNHNIVRHPDMPPEAFQDLWDTIKEGKPWIGIVKNRCKNGDHYWVNAYVTPMYEGDQIVGYQSVRTKPRREWIKRASGLYSFLLSGKKSLFKWTLSLRHKYFVSLAMMSLAISTIGLLDGAEKTVLLPVAIGAVGVSWGLAFWLTRSLAKVAEEAKQIYHNDVALQVYGDAPDEVGQVQLALAALQSRQVTLSTRMDDAATNLAGVSQDASNNAQATADDVERQRMSLEDISAAVKQMVGSIREVTESVVKAAEASQDADQEAKESRQRVQEMINSMSVLAEGVEEATKAVRSLHERSESIGGLIDVIRNVAEQTNLLALNAAIEAARAGEYGRGFAVVADEVRVLATRTQESTEEIEKVVASMREGVEQAVHTMERDYEKTQHSMEAADNTSQALDEIVRSVATIAEMNNQIATTTEEQSSVSEEISHRIHEVHEVAEITAKTMADNLASSRGLAKMAEGLSRTVRQFK